MEDKFEDLVDRLEGLSYFPATGSSLPITSLYNPPVEDKSTFSNSFLQNPAPQTVAAIAKVAHRFNKNADSVRQIITDILNCCVFFNVSDTSQIAYIFASICLESNFGLKKKMVEDTRFYVNMYEPVFLKTDSEKPVRDNSRKYAELKSIEIFLLNSVGDLLKQKSDQITQEKLNSLQSKINSALDDIDDTTLTGFLSEIANNNIPVLTKDFVNNKYLHRNTALTQPLIDYLKNYQSDEKNAIQLQFNILQLKVLLIDWVIIRIHKSSNLGNRVRRDGELFKGRGLTQLTGRSLYTFFNTQFEDQNSPYYKAAEALKATPVPNLLNSENQEDSPVAKNTLSAVVTVGGMAQGKFTNRGRKLSKYGTGDQFNFFEARRIINGVNRAQEGVDIAKSFVLALKI